MRIKGLEERLDWVEKNRRVYEEEEMGLKRLRELLRENPGKEIPLATVITCLEEKQDWLSMALTLADGLIGGSVLLLSGLNVTEKYLTDKDVGDWRLDVMDSGVFERD